MCRKGSIFGLALVTCVIETGLEDSPSWTTDKKQANKHEAAVLQIVMNIIPNKQTNPDFYK